MKEDMKCTIQAIMKPQIKAQIEAEMKQNMKYEINAPNIASFVSLTSQMV